MKKISVFCAMLFLAALLPLQAQRFAYVDTEYVLGKMPEYQAAQKQLNQLAEGWQVEVEAVMIAAERLYQKFESEKVMLSQSMQAEREQEIVNKEQEAKNLQQKYFGRDGEMIRRQQELIKPIQDKVYQAVKDMAAVEGYTIVFDTAGGANVLYANPKNDKSDDLLKRLGY